MELLIIFITGILVGCICTVIISRKRSIGSVRIDSSDPDDNPYLFLELSQAINILYRKKYITLKVDTRSFITRK